MKKKAQFATMMLLALITLSACSDHVLPPSIGIIQGTAGKDRLFSALSGGL